MSNMIPCYQVTIVYPDSEQTKLFLNLDEAQEKFREYKQDAENNFYKEWYHTETKLYMTHPNNTDPTKKDLSTITIEIVELSPYMIAMCFLDDGEMPGDNWPQAVHICYAIACDDYIDEANYDGGDYNEQKV